MELKTYAQLGASRPNEAHTPKHISNSKDMKDSKICLIISTNSLYAYNKEKRLVTRKA